MRTQLSEAGHFRHDSSNSRGLTAWADRDDLPAGTNSTNSNRDSVRSDSAAQHLHQQQQHHGHVAEARVLYYYLRTSPAVNPLSADAGSQRSPLLPLKVSVHTDSDMQAKEQQLQELQQQDSIFGGPSSTGTSLGGLLSGSGCDVFCSVSSSKQALTLSVVARGSAAVDNLFLGVTSVNHTDQRGLQVRRDIVACIIEHAAACS